MRYLTVTGNICKMDRNGEMYETDKTFKKNYRLDRITLEAAARIIKDHDYRFEFTEKYNREEA